MFIGNTDRKNLEFKRGKDKKKRKRRKKRFYSKKDIQKKNRIGLGIAGASALGLAYGVKKSKDFEKADMLGLENKLLTVNRHKLIERANEIKNNARLQTGITNSINTRTGGVRKKELEDNLRNSLSNLKDGYNEVKNASRAVRQEVKDNNSKIRKMRSLNPFV